MIINVTQKHILHGTQYGCTTCPVALAIREQTEFKRAEVGIYSWGRGQDHPQDSFPLPAKASVFINKFDVGVHVEPFSFELEIP